ncbi:MAG TPA: NAD(P)/FAD-dependent oxidoreductase [Candidatus Limnocylindrales bacterium]|nr:NAD(P)/FAD-dependent oxidoreductase [Candidatus Limnocylindrales bacterium]
MVIGGGPAGLAAARVAAQSGVRVVLVDDNEQLGGQYYRQLPPGWQAAGSSRLGRESAEGRRLIDEVRALGVELHLGTTAWGIFDGHTVALATRDEARRLYAQTLVLAPGAYDRPVPFPGWTLPGVITAGGAQNLMKAYGVLPGRRVLIAGSGPLLLAVAHYLIGGGAQVVALCEAAPMKGLWRHGVAMLPHLNFVQQGYRYWQEIRREGIPVRPGHIIRRALGSTQVDRAIVSRCDGAWRPVVGTEESFDVDAVVVGYGFVSSLELSRLAGCEHEYVDSLAGWVPVRSRDMETTVPGVFVVGDGAGAAGSAVALEEGRLAGLTVAHRLGHLTGRDFERERARSRGRLLHLGGFRRVMDRLYRVGPGLYTLADAETVLCRCEETTVDSALAAVSDGATHVNEVKAWTRTGMGRCQGRMCGPALAHLIAEATDRPVPDAGVFTPRPPARPVTLGALAQDGG